MKQKPQATQWFPSVHSVPDTKCSLYYTGNMYISESIHKIAMPKHEAFHSPEQFPFLALGNAPCGFIYL